MSAWGNSNLDHSSRAPIQEVKEAGFEPRAHGVTVEEPSAVCVSHSQLQAASALVIGTRSQLPWGLSTQLSASLGAQYKLLPFCYPHPLL